MSITLEHATDLAIGTAPDVRPLTSDDSGSCHASRRDQMALCAAARRTSAGCAQRSGAGKWPSRKRVWEPTPWQADWKREFERVDLVRGGGRCRSSMRLLALSRRLEGTREGWCRYCRALGLPSRR